MRLTLAFSLILTLGGFSAFADTAAWEFTTPGTAFTNDSWTFGIDFTVGSSNVTVDALGYYDDSGNGFNDNHQVGMYDSLGNLLASTTVTSASTLDGHFRYASITPIVLLAGDTYRMVGVSQSDLYTWDNPGFAADPLITYNGDTYDHGTTLFDPTGQFHNDVSDGFFGPDFLISGTQSPVPEPSTVPLLAVALGIALMVLRRKKQPQTL